VPRHVAGTPRGRAQHSFAVNAEGGIDRLMYNRAHAFGETLTAFLRFYRHVDESRRKATRGGGARELIRLC